MSRDDLLAKNKEIVGGVCKEVAERSPDAIVLVVTNPLPAEALPREIYGDLVADARARGCRTLVDLSTPRLDSALRGEPDLVKLNDWELAEFVSGPVSPHRSTAPATSRRRFSWLTRVMLTHLLWPRVLNCQQAS